MNPDTIIGAVTDELDEEVATTLIGLMPREDVPLSDERVLQWRRWAIAATSEHCQTDEHNNVAIFQVATRLLNAK